MSGASVNSIISMAAEGRDDAAGAAPVYVATPYTEIIADDQYVIIEFVFSHGPLNFEDHRLGACI